MTEYVWIFKNGQGFEYVSYNTLYEVTLQVNEYLFTYSKPCQRSKMKPFGKVIIVFNYLQKFPS